MISLDISSFIRQPVREHNLSWSVDLFAYLFRLSISHSVIWENYNEGNTTRSKESQRLLGKYIKHWRVTNSLSHTSSFCTAHMQKWNKPTNVSWFNSKVMFSRAFTIDLMLTGCEPKPGQKVLLQAIKRQYFNWSDLTHYLQLEILVIQKILMNSLFVIEQYLLIILN